ncbi:hypothetical protein FRACYDRAFT_237546 [Fragilariopsis cylindrus CCMP1102]|uniref:Uncharacterized protein n=1 Tax=Fragilariopsis cylindrus CCMP1102 TaxID=635003 RepID=A0A1E7FG61_9STRA|nr:hypothetical protein FRACYDRAFT_237546 [Fragilariopsis cylindrus CCMP1102]|eukprot:OEU17136.1 hypothetical protein FRACYDRAFT_237546 [Fragilariopsis cylindrus CCMP1102]
MPSLLLLLLLLLLLWFYSTIHHLYYRIENTTIDYYNSSENTNNTFVDDDDDTSSKVAVAGSTTTDNIANTTIHMTDCRGQSSLRLQIPVQQLRIHQSTGLHIKTMINQNQNPMVKTKTASTAWKPGTIILETSKDIIFFVPPLPLVLENNASTNTDSEINIVTQQQQQDQLLSRTSSTKTYWHQVIVKDFQWLRKGISSPNVLVIVETSTNNNNNENNSSDSIERTTYIPQGIDDEDNNSSDDEL